MKGTDRDIVDRIRLSVRGRLAAQNAKRIKKAADMRDRYRALRAAGLCARCKEVEAIPGMALCESCRLWNNQRRSGSATAPRSPYKDGRRRQ